jgi:ABC-2 type transport system permease protein
VSAARPMRPRDVVRLVAAREISERARTKAFRITLVLLALGAAATAVLSTYARDDSSVEVVHVAIDTVRTDALREALEAAGPAAQLDPIVAALSDDAAVTDAVRRGVADVGIVGGATLVWRHESDPTVAAVATAAIDVVARRVRAEELGIGADQLTALATPVPVESRVLDPRDRDRGVRIATATIGAIVLYIAIQVTGSMLMSGLISEKSTRVVEVLLNHIRARHLLAGKVLGIGIIGLAQIGVTAAAGAGALLVTRDVGLPKVPVDAIAWFVVWFVLGYAIYAALFAMAASLVSRQEDAASVTMPVMLPLVATYLLSFAAAQAADDQLARVLAVVPFSAPLIMPIRIAAGHPSAVAVAASLVLSAATVVLLLRLAGRLYGRTLLRTGSRLTWGEAGRALLGGHRARARHEDRSTL